MDIFLKGATVVCLEIVDFTITESYSVFLCAVIDFSQALICPRHREV